MVQERAPESEYFPAAHEVHVKAPEVAEYVPETQVKQAVAPALEYFPAAQSTGVDVSVTQKLPAGHWVEYVATYTPPGVTSPVLSLVKHPTAVCP